MKRIRLLGALALCLALTCPSTSALAASKAATTKPTVKVTVPQGAVRGGVGDDITITPSAPGFLTLKLLSESGAELRVICDNQEVHTSKNLFEFDARDAEGAPLATGAYQLSASVVDQYGNVSKTTTANYKVGAPLPSLSNLSVSAAKGFKPSVSFDAYFDASAKNAAASVEFALYRTQPEAAYIDDFDTIDLTVPCANATNAIDLSKGATLPSAAGYYTAKGFITEQLTGIKGDPIEIAFVIDFDGNAYTLDSAPEEVIEAVDVYVEAIETGTYTEPEEEEPAKEEPAKKGSSKAQSSDKKAASAAAEGMTYAAGECTTGEEGFEIGAGVSDAVPQTETSFWTLTGDASNEEIWQAITRPLVSWDDDEQKSAHIYNSTEQNRKSLGTVSALTQGLNVVAERDDGWSLVEAFRNEDGAFVRGYVRSNRLRITDPNTTYGIVIDKKTQTLTVWKDGAPIGSCKVTTGLPTAKYPHRETPAGEYILGIRRGTIEYYGNGFSKNTIRLSGNYQLCEIPSTKKNGTDFSLLEEALGTKATRGHICIAHEASSDGGINAAWIWEMTDTNKRVKVLVLDDKDRCLIPVTSK